MVHTTHEPGTQRISNLSVPPAFSCQAATMSELIQGLPSQTVWSRQPIASCYRRIHREPLRTSSCCRSLALARTHGKALPWRWWSRGSGSIWSGPPSCGSSSRRGSATCAHRLSTRSGPGWRTCDPGELWWSSSGRRVSQIPILCISITHIQKTLLANTEKWWKWHWRLVMPDPFQFLFLWRLFTFFFIFISYDVVFICATFPILEKWHFSWASCCATLRTEFS